MSQKTDSKQYRIVEVRDDMFGHYFAAQRKSSIFGRWKDISWDVPSKLDKEWRCHSVDEAKRRLEEYKNKNAVKVLYEE